jgi:hypothetical protein
MWPEPQRTHWLALDRSLYKSMGVRFFFWSIPSFLNEAF